MNAIDECLSQLMEAYNVYQKALRHDDVTMKVDKNKADDSVHKRLIADTFYKYTCLIPKSNTSPPCSPGHEDIFEEAIRFCQQHTTHKDTVDPPEPLRDTGTPAANLKNPPSQNEADTPADVVKDLTAHDVTETDAVKNGVDQVKDETVTKFEIPTCTSTPNKPPAGKVILVQTKGQTYTRIGPPPNIGCERPFAPSPNSAFRPTSSKVGVEGKRLPVRLDPRLQHLKIQVVNDLGKNSVFRSSSVPVIYPEGEENTPPHHRQLRRTGSYVSDSTKLKLKCAILAKTSAALVRKPSITDQEMMQIHGDPDADSDSSQSEDEEEELMQKLSERKRKYSDEAPPAVSANEHPAFISPLQSTTITTAGST